MKRRPFFRLPTASLAIQSNTVADNNLGNATHVVLDGNGHFFHANAINERDREALPAFSDRAFVQLHTQWHRIGQLVRRAPTEDMNNGPYTSGADTRCTNLHFSDRQLN